MPSTNHSSNVSVYSVTILRNSNSDMVIIICQSHQLFLFYLQNETPQTDPWNEPWCGNWPPNVPVHWCACSLDTTHLAKWHTNTPDSVDDIESGTSKRNIFTVLGAYLVTRPAGGCRCHPSREWLCRTRKWGAALTVGQSAASRQFQQESGTHTTRKEAHAGSRRTGPDSAPVRVFQSVMREELGLF